MKVLYAVLIISFIIINYYKTKRSLHMLQQNLYNENNRYGKWLFKNYKDLEVLVLEDSDNKSMRFIL